MGLSLSYTPSLVEIFCFFYAMCIPVSTLFRPIECTLLLCFLVHQRKKKIPQQKEVNSPTKCTKIQPGNTCFACKFQNLVKSLKNQVVETFKFCQKPCQKLLNFGKASELWQSFKTLSTASKIRQLKPLECDKQTKVLCQSFRSFAQNF